MQPPKPDASDEIKKDDKIDKGLKYLNNGDPETQRIWELFRYFRSEIQHEHTLLMGRVTWYITCQSFLLTIYAVSSIQAGCHNWFSNNALPALGILISFLAFFMMNGAIKTIDDWGKLRKELVNAANRPSSYDSGLDPILIDRWRSKNSSKTDFLHVRALLFPRLIAIIFPLFWIVILIFSRTSPWAPHCK